MAIDAYLKTSHEREADATDYGTAYGDRKKPTGRRAKKEREREEKGDVTYGGPEEAYVPPDPES